MRFLVNLKGSIQNPTYSPNGGTFLFTRFRNGYGIGAADLYICDVRDRERMVAVTDNAKPAGPGNREGELQGATNTNAPGYGNVWHRNGAIIFATDAGHRGGAWPAKVTVKGEDWGFLPGYQDLDYDGVHASWSPSADEFVFERHKRGDGEPGEIVVALSDGLGEPQHKVISKGDARKPSWSPDAQHVAWQQRDGEDWRIAVHHLDTGDTKLLTPKNKSFTCPTWHPDSTKLLVSGDNAIYEVTTLGLNRPAFAVEHPRTACLTAPSWSPDQIRGGRRRLMCEGTDRENPDGGPGTWLEIY